MSINRLRKRFASSETLSQQGIWVTVDLGDDGKPIEFKIARMGRINRRWASQASKVYRAHKRKIDAGLMSDNESIYKSLRVFCATVLLDWRGVEDENDNPIPYSVDAGVNLLKECDGLYDYLLEESQEIQNYQEVEVNETVGKSEPTTSGT